MDNIKLYAVRYEVAYEGTSKCFIFSNEADAQIKYSVRDPWEGHCDSVVLIGPFDFGMDAVGREEHDEEIPVIDRRQAVQDYGP